MYRRTSASTIAPRAFAAKGLHAMADVALHSLTGDIRWVPPTPLALFPDVRLRFLPSPRILSSYC
eukprot:3481080-Pyramimonas_sp.AAC.1